MLYPIELRMRYGLANAYRRSVRRMLTLCRRNQVERNGTPPERDSDAAHAPQSLHRPSRYTKVFDPRKRRVSGVDLSRDRIRHAGGPKHSSHQSSRRGRREKALWGLVEGRWWGALIRKRKQEPTGNPVGSTSPNPTNQPPRLLEMVQPTEIGVKQRRLETQKGEKTHARKKPIEAASDLPAIDEFFLRSSHCISVRAAAVPHSSGPGFHRSTLRSGQEVTRPGSHPGPGYPPEPEDRASKASPYHVAE